MFVKAKPHRAVLLPMGQRVAIIGYLDVRGLPPRRPAFEEHFDLCDSWVEWINAATCGARDRFIDLLIAHPDARAELEHLPDPKRIHVNEHGPFMYRFSNDFFD